VGKDPRAPVRRCVRVDEAEKMFGAAKVHVDAVELTLFAQPRAAHMTAPEYMLVFARRHLPHQRLDVEYDHSRRLHVTFCRSEKMPRP
jgi:hypothetical protein